MNILHISDLHFGTRHWKGNDQLLLEKLNSYTSDLIINTGDNTTDSLESEFRAAGVFLDSLNCEHVISIPGNHDKRNMRAQDFFRKYIDNIEVIRPMDPSRCNKNKILIDQYTTGITEHFTDINFIKKITIDGKSLLVVCIDSNDSYQDIGTVDREMLHSVSQKVSQLEYDNIILLNHYSILDADGDPMFHSDRIIDFVKHHKIEHVFCGHGHNLEINKTTDLIRNCSFTQYKNGTLGSRNSHKDSNMFLYYENFAEDNMKIHIVRIRDHDGQLEFEENLIDITGV